MHRPVLLNKTITMRKEELFEGAIILARRSLAEKRSRCRVIEVQAKALPDLAVSTVRDTKGTYYAMRYDIQPAKLTKKSLEECGFVESKCYGCKGRCFLYKGTRVHLLLRDSNCGFKVRNILQVPWRHKQVRYMHEVQREVAKLKIKDYLK